jgi:nicotinamidase-related amidase
MLVIMTRALLIIDVQESFRQGPLWPAISNPGIAGDVARLVDGARANGDLVVWVLHSEPGSGTTFDPASGHVRYIDPLKPQAGEPQLTKTSHNAFTTTNLQQLFTQQGITEVIVCGIRTEQCCETTARVASDLGYQVTFVTEATTTSPIAPPQRARRSSSCSRTPARCQPARSSSGPSTRSPGGSRPSPRSRRSPARPPCPRP